MRAQGDEHIQFVRDVADLRKERLEDHPHRPRPGAVRDNDQHAPLAKVLGGTSGGDGIRDLRDGDESAGRFTFGE